MLQEPISLHTKGVTGSQSRMQPNLPGQWRFSIEQEKENKVCAPDQVLTGLIDPHVTCWDENNHTGLSSLEGKKNQHYYPGDCTAKTRMEEKRNFFLY